MGTKNSQTEHQKQLTELNEDDVEKVTITSNSILFHKEDGIKWCKALTRLDKKCTVHLNGMDITSAPGGTWQPTLELTRVEKVDVHIETTEQTGDEKDAYWITLQGNGEFSAA